MNVSLHLTDHDFFCEVDLLPEADQETPKTITQLRSRLNRWRDDLDNFNKTTILDHALPYGKRVLIDFPKRVAKFAEFTRIDEEQGAIVLRT